jgi:hypothetical protein
MTLYARVQDGVVAELFTPPDGVSIASCFVASIAAMFVAAPDGVQQGWTYDGSAFAAPTPPPPPNIQQQAAALLGQPVTVVCTSISALNGTYPIDAATQAQITGIASAINAGLGLPSGQSTFNWPDTSGIPHPWPATQFTAFAQKVMKYLYDASQVAQGNGTTLPSQTLVIP